MFQSGIATRGWVGVCVMLGLATQPGWAQDEVLPPAEVPPKIKDREHEKSAHPKTEKSTREAGAYRPVPPGMTPGARPGRGARGMLPDGAGGRNRIDTMIYEALGIEQPVKLEQLTYAAEKRLVLKVPVGGIDHLDERKDGWRAEQIFVLTDEQLKSLTSLRDEYKDELKKLQQELEAANLAVALQVKELRQKYEQRANDVLTGEAKTEKVKLDALAKEFCAQLHAKAQGKKPEVDAAIAEVLKQLSVAQETGNWQALGEATKKGYEVVRTMRDDPENLAKEFLEKMKAALTGEAKARLEQEFQGLEKKHVMPANPAFKPGEGMPKKPDTAGGDNF